MRSEVEFDFSDRPVVAVADGPEPGLLDDGPDGAEEKGQEGGMGLADPAAVGPTDLWLAVITFLLVLLGLVMVYSASSPIALKKFGDPSHFALRNGIYALLGTVALALASRLHVEQIRTLGRYGFWICILLLVVVLVPGIGMEAGGARRWINLRVVSLQPSEPFKVMLVLYVAHYLTARPERVRRFLSGVLPLLMVFGVAGALLMREPDFGATMIAGAVLMGMVFLAGVPTGWVAGLFLVSVPAAAAAVLMAPYRLKRVTSFLDPWDDPLASDFQLVQSLLAFGNGGVLGTGLGEGSQKQFYLPEAHTDFILAVIAEEMGLVMLLVMILLFGALVWRIFAIARLSQDRFASLAAAGLGLLVGSQALANMGVVMGMLPPKGLTLPMVSYGGSSLVITMAAMGLLLSLSRTVPAGAGRKPAKGGSPP